MNTPNSLEDSGRIRTLSVLPIEFVNHHNPMSINAKDAVDFLVANGYAFWHGRKLKTTAKLYDDLDRPATGEPVDWEKRYQAFILAAAVPRNGESSKGETYNLNRFSIKACQAFKRAILQGFDEQIMIEATKLYYRSKTTLKMSIGRYIEEGYWRTDYNSYLSAREEGTTQQLEKQETSNGVHSAWTVG